MISVTESIQKTDMEQFRSRALQVVVSVKEVIVGKDELIRDLLIAMLAEGNVLLEGVPGVAKTTIAKAFAAALGLEFKRIQFVPDILPGDITGMSVYNQHTASFEVRKGPIFSNILLVDEINRASPKIQSALLEAMEEKQVSIDGTTYPLPSPFMVITTQNQIDIAGTYPLPEAQIDRFMFKLNVDYLSPVDELNLIRAKNVTSATTNPRVLSQPDIRGMIRMANGVHVDERIMEYIRDIIVASRRHDRLLLGGSSRASLALLRASKVCAAFYGRDYVTPDDVKYLVPKVLVHRIIVKPEFELDNVTSAEVVAELLRNVKVPV